MTNLRRSTYSLIGFLAVALLLVPGTVSAALVGDEATISITRTALLIPNDGYWTPTGTLALSDPARFLVYYRLSGDNQITPGGTIQITHDGQTVYRYAGRMVGLTSPGGEKYFVYAIQHFYARFLMGFAATAPLIAHFTITAGSGQQSADLQFTGINGAPGGPSTGAGCRVCSRPPSKTHAPAPSITIDKFFIKGLPLKNSVRVSVHQRMTFIVTYQIQNGQDTPDATISFSRMQARSPFPFLLDGSWYSNSPAEMEPPDASGVFVSDVMFSARKTVQVMGVCTLSAGKVKTRRTLIITVTPS